MPPFPTAATELGSVANSMFVNGFGICVSIDNLLSFASSSGNGSVRGGRIGWKTAGLNVVVGMAVSSLDDFSAGSVTVSGTNGIVHSYGGKSRFASI